MHDLVISSRLWMRLFLPWTARTPLPGAPVCAGGQHTEFVGGELPTGDKGRKRVYRVLFELMDDAAWKAIHLIY